MSDNLGYRSSRGSSARSASSTSSQRAPQIRGVVISLQNHDVVKTIASLAAAPSKQVCRTNKYVATLVRQPAKAAATSLMQPFSVLSQSWYTNLNETEEAVPQWVLDGARIADDSPRSSSDSLESRDNQVSPEDSSTSPEHKQRSFPIVCKAILASWKQANRPPRWVYEATPT